MTIEIEDEEKTTRSDIPPQSKKISFNSLIASTKEKEAKNTSRNTLISQGTELKKTVQQFNDNDTVVSVQQSSVNQPPIVSVQNTKSANSAPENQSKFVLGAKPASTKKLESAANNGKETGAARGLGDQVNPLQTNMQTTRSSSPVQPAAVAPLTQITQKNVAAHNQQQTVPNTISYRAKSSLSTVAKNALEQGNVPKQDMSSKVIYASKSESDSNRVDYDKSLEKSKLKEFIDKLDNYTNLLPDDAKYRPKTYKTIDKDSKAGKKISLIQDNLGQINLLQNSKIAKRFNKQGNDTFSTSFRIPGVLRHQHVVTADSVTFKRSGLLRGSYEATYKKDETGNFIQTFHSQTRRGGGIHSWKMEADKNGQYKRTVTDGNKQSVERFGEKGVYQKSTLNNKKAFYSFVREEAVVGADGKAIYGGAKETQSLFYKKSTVFAVDKDIKYVQRKFLGVGLGTQIAEMTEKEIATRDLQLKANGLAEVSKGSEGDRDTSVSSVGSGSVTTTMLPKQFSAQHRAQHRVHSTRGNSDGGRTL